MRIDAYQQVQQVYGTRQTCKMQAGQKADYQDRLQSSSTGKDIQAAKQAINGTPDVREEAVASLKAQIEAGTYQVGVDAFAAHLFQKYNELNVGSF